MSLDARNSARDNNPARSFGSCGPASFGGEGGAVHSVIASFGATPSPAPGTPAPGVFRSTVTALGKVVGTYLKLTASVQIVRDANGEADWQETARKAAIKLAVDFIDIPGLGLLIGQDSKGNALVLIDSGEIATVMLPMWKHDP